jgi:hypothetical protein
MRRRNLYNRLRCLRIRTTLLGALSSMFSFCDEGQHRVNVCNAARRAHGSKPAEEEDDNDDCPSCCSEPPRKLDVVGDASSCRTLDNVVDAVVVGNSVVVLGSVVLVIVAVVVDGKVVVVNFVVMVTVVEVGQGPKPPSLHKVVVMVVVVGQGSKPSSPQKRHSKFTPSAKHPFAYVKGSHLGSQA